MSCEHSSAFFKCILVLSYVETGFQEVRIVHHQSLNKRILVALIACSALLGGTFLFLLYVWLRRHKYVRSSNGKSLGTMGMTIFSLETFLLLLHRGNALQAQKKNPFLSLTHFTY